MDIAHPALLVATMAVVAVILALVASHLISRAADRLIANAGDGSDTDLSRIRPRNR